MSSTFCTEHVSQLGRDQWLEIFIKKQKLKYFEYLKRSEGLEKIEWMGKEKEEDGSGKWTYRMITKMSLTEVGRLAIDRNCFRCVVKDAMSLMGISSWSSASSTFCHGVKFSCFYI